MPATPFAKVISLGIRNPPKCRCGQPFKRLAVTHDERGTPYWCWQCDAHGVGCRDHAHPAGKCKVVF